MIREIEEYYSKRCSEENVWARFENGPQFESEEEVDQWIESMKNLFEDF